MDSLTAKLFIDTVEGIESEGSCKLVDGALIVTEQPIKWGDQPDLSLLADVLRSDIELPPHVRAWLADLVDPQASSDAALMFRNRSAVELGKALFRKKGPYTDWPIADFVADCIDEMRANGVPERALRKRAIAKACDHFGISDTKVTDAIAIRQAAYDSLDKPFNVKAD